MKKLLLGLLFFAAIAAVALIENPADYEWESGSTPQIEYDGITRSDLRTWAHDLTGLKPIDVKEHLQQMLDNCTKGE